MPLTIDYGNQIVGITSPTVNVDGQVLHDFIEDNMASPEGLLYDDVIQPEGKIEDPNNPGVYSQIILIFNSPWQVQFWGGSGYTRIYGAKIVGGLADQPMKATGTAGDITVLESPVDGLTVVSGSGVTAQDKVDIITGVWDLALAGHITAGTTGEKLNNSSELVVTDVEDAVWDADPANHGDADSFGLALKTLLGLQQHNFRLKDQIYQQVNLGNNNFKYVLTSGTIRVYSNAADAGNDVNHFAQYTITASYDGNGNCTAYTSVPV